MDIAGLSQLSVGSPNPEASGAGTGRVKLGRSADLSSPDMLQNMLIDERMRCEHHKTNYQTLKAEHTRLQGEYARLQNELKKMLSEKQTAQEKLQLLLAELRAELLDKTRELEELKLQVMTPQRLELLKAQVQQEMETPIRDRFRKLEEEAEKYRSEYNKLRYELTFLKSEFDHQREEHERILEERKLRYTADLLCLEKDKEELSAQLRTGDPARDGKRVEALLCEKAQLHQRLRGLEAEVAELRAQKDSTGAQAENTQRIQLRQLAETQTALKALEVEKQSVCMHLERVEKDLHLSQEQNTVLTSKVHKAEREISALNNQVEELRHTHKLELTNVKLESLKVRGDVERERDALQDKVESLQSDIEMLKESAEKSKELLTEREREMVRRIHAAREEEMQKLAASQEEKMELENRLSDLEQQKVLQEAAGRSRLEEVEDHLRAAQLAEEVSRKELQNIKGKLQQQVLQQEEVERQKMEIMELKKQNAEFTLQIGTLSHSESELMDANGRLKESLERVREELRSTRAQMERTQHEAERLVEEQRVSWLEEKHKLQHRYNQAKERLQRASLAQKKRKNLTEAKEKKLEDKIQLLEAKIEELEIESRVAKKNPAFSVDHAQLNRRLKDLQKRHQEFRHLLMGNHMTSTPLPSALHVSAPECTFAILQDDQHQRELSGLRRRLEELENSQQLQLQELTPPLDRDQLLPRRDSLSDSDLHPSS